MLEFQRDETSHAAIARDSLSIMISANNRGSGPNWMSFMSNLYRRLSPEAWIAEHLQSNTSGDDRRPCQKGSILSSRMAITRVEPWTL